MGFRRFPHYKERMYYEPLASKVFKFPRGNLFAGVTLDLRAEINIVDDDANAIPDFQIPRMIKELTIVKGTDTIWQLSGEVLGLLFSHRNGIVAPGNAGIAVTTANNVKGRHVLNLNFAPPDALKPWDFLMDTRKYEYEMRIQFRDVTAYGTFFGGSDTTGSLTATAAENYVDITLDQLDLKPGPKGLADELTDKSPLMRGLIERTTDITQNNAALKIDLPELKTYRNLFLWATHQTAALQTQGNGSVLSGNIALKDSQEKTYQNVQASDLKQETAFMWGNGSLNAGFYHMAMAKWGAAVDAEVFDLIRKPYLLAAVTKQTNATALRVIADTIERQ